MSDEIKKVDGSLQSMSDEELKAMLERVRGERKSRKEQLIKVRKPRSSAPKQRKEKEVIDLSNVPEL